MKVLKFGGSSIASAETIQRVKNIVEQSIDNKWIVISAMEGVTDQLIKACGLAAVGDEAYKALLADIESRHLAAAKALVELKRQGHVLSGLKVLLNELEDYLRSIVRLGELTAKTQDYVLSFGERLSSYLLSEVIAEAEWLDSRAFIKTDSRFGTAQVDFAATRPLCAERLATIGGRAVIPGFIASDSAGATTTLGRGGSDYTAAIIAAAVGASMVEIWSDTDGFLTADPRKVQRACTIRQMTYAEAFELSNFGAKVVYPPTVYPLFKENIPLLIKNTFHPEAEGSLIDAKGAGESNCIKGISSVENAVLLSLQGVGMTGVVGISRRLFGALEQARANVLFISQASSEQSITFAVVPHDAPVAERFISQTFAAEMLQGTLSLKVEEDMSIIAIVGENMRCMPGTAGKMFNVLGENNINIIAIAQGSSELNISTVVRRDCLDKALNVIHDDFFTSK